MDDDRRDAIRRLSARLGSHVYGSDPAAQREGFWALYLLWLLHEQTDTAIKAEAHRERSAAVHDLDRLYGRCALCDDLAQIARKWDCDMFDVVLLMPTIVEDLVEMRRLQNDNV